MENEQLMTFIPIGFQAKSDSSLWENNGFAGEFYGNGYEIKGIFINDNSGDSEAHYKGLFGALLDGGVVSNLSVSGCVYSTGSNTGGIVGKSSSLIEHCRFSGVVMGAYNVGGIVGESNTESTITNCMNMALIRWQYKHSWRKLGWYCWMCKWKSYSKLYQPWKCNLKHLC
ncbi:hypothetical protein MKD14_04385 [[Clostridium] innocuum]|nr:hypothetical protein [[Clostridium] innocuum]